MNIIVNILTQFKTEFQLIHIIDYINFNINYIKM